jgi:hypothetical protein
MSPVAFVASARVVYTEEVRLQMPVLPGRGRPLEPHDSDDERRTRLILGGTASPPPARGLPPCWCSPADP